MLLTDRNFNTSFFWSKWWRWSGIVSTSFLILWSSRSVYTYFTCLWYY
jgi:hypothetical protein